MIKKRYSRRGTMLLINAVKLLVLLSFMDTTSGQAVCNQAATQACLGGASNPAALGSIVEQCRSVYPIAEDCLRGIIAVCGSTDADKAVVTGVGASLTLLDRICSEQFIQEYGRHVQCYDRPVVVSEIVACNTRLTEHLQINTMNLDVDGLCRSVHRYRACLSIAINASCGKDAAEVIDDLATFSLESALASVLPSCNVREPLHKYCYPNPCFNGGECDSPTGKPVCSCKKGFEGPICDEVKVVEGAGCQTLGCLNGGHCVVESSKYSCLCSNGYTGTRCEIPPTNNEEQSNGLTTGVIIAIVLGIIAALVLGIVVTLLAVCRLKLQKEQTHNTNNADVSPTGQHPPQNPGWQQQPQPQQQQQRQHEMQMKHLPQMNNVPPSQPSAPDLLQQQVNLQMQQNAQLLMATSPPVLPPRYGQDANNPVMNMAQPALLSPAELEQYLKTYVQKPQALDPYSQPRDMEAIMSEIWKLQSQMNASS